MNLRQYLTEKVKGYNKRREKAVVDLACRLND